MKDLVKEHPWKSAGLALIAVVAATLLFGPETVKGWIEAVWSSQQETGQ